MDLVEDCGVHSLFIEVAIVTWMEALVQNLDRMGLSGVSLFEKGGFGEFNVLVDF